MTLTLTFAWWMAPVALAVLVLIICLWACAKTDGGAFNPVPGLIGCATILVVIALLFGALFAWLAGR